MAVNIISWNIYHFSTNRAGAALGTANAHRCNIILDLVNPLAGPTCDIFVIIETQTDKPWGYGVVGDLANGDGITATQQLLAALQVRTATWEAVLPVYLTARRKTEAISIFFNSANITLTGPLTDLAIAAGSAWRTAATQSGLGTFKGRATYNSALGAPLVFNANPERRPYLVTFTDGGGNAFTLLAHHSPKPNNAGANQAAQQGTSWLADITQITTARATPVIIVGDFNCCAVPNCPPPGYYANDITAQNSLTGNGGVEYPYGQAAMSAIRAAIRATTETEAADAAAVNAAAAAGLLVPNAVTARAEAVNAQTAAANAATHADAAADAMQRINAASLLIAAAQLAANNARGATVSAGGGLAGTYSAEAAAAALLAHAARDAALNITDTLFGCANLAINALARAVRFAVTAIDNPGGSAVPAANAGAQLTATVNATAAAPNTAVARAAAPAIVTNCTVLGGLTNGNGVARAKAARDAALAISNGLYVTHIGANRSSLKKTATPASYRNHAFDHVLTIGVRDARNARVIDLVPGAITTYHAPFGLGMNTNTFKAGYKYIAIWGSKGVSDHLPVAITVDIV